MLYENFISMVPASKHVKTLLENKFIEEGESYSVPPPLSHRNCGIFNIRYNF